jgi:hypothetical protein
VRRVASGQLAVENELSTANYLKENPVTIPNRLTVKFFIQEEADFDAAPFIPLFHRWIREGAGAGLLIDVADYRHVQDGPAVILVGHEVDYAIDLDGGRPGLLVRQKRCASGDLAERLRTLLRLALGACNAIASDGGLEGRVRFDPARLEVTFPDRLHTPNSPEVLAAVQPVVQTVLNELYGQTAIKLEHANADGRWPLSLRATVEAASNRLPTINDQRPTTNYQLSTHS